MDNLRSSITNCYNTYFNYRKQEDKFINIQDFERVIDSLNEVFKDSDLLDLHGFWMGFLFNGLSKSNTNILNNLGFVNYSLIELYFRYTILDIFNLYIYPSGKKYAVKLSNGVIIPEIQCAGLSLLLQNNKQNNLYDIKELLDSWNFFPKRELMYYSDAPNPLIQLFEPLLRSKNLNKEDAIRFITYNQFFLALKRHDCHHTFDNFNSWLLTFKIPAVQIKGFRIKKEHEILLPKIYELIKDYIQNDKPQKLFNTIFNTKGKKVSIPLSLKKEDVWLMPYIISQLNCRDIIHTPKKDKHWPVFEHCFHLDGKPYTENQKIKFKPPKEEKSTLLKDLKNLLAEI